jgi:hypothetical protein
MSEVLSISCRELAPTVSAGQPLWTIAWFGKGEGGVFWQNRVLEAANVGVP